MESIGKIVILIVGILSILLVWPIRLRVLADWKRKMFYRFFQRDLFEWDIRGLIKRIYRHNEFQLDYLFLMQVVLLIILVTLVLLTVLWLWN